MPKIVLSLITKNSYEKVGEYFHKVWLFSLQIPYDTIILIDDSNSDKTSEFVKKFAKEYHKELIIEIKPNSIVGISQRVPPRDKRQ